MALRSFESYPPQEPLSEIGIPYNAEVRKLGAGIDGDNFAYGDDPYQEVAVFKSDNPNRNGPRLHAWRWLGQWL